MSSPCGQGSGHLPGAPLSLPQVSVCSPRAAQVSGGLWGRRSPLPLGLQQSPSPQEACLENIPALEGLRRGRHNDSPATYADTAGGPSTQTRARTHTVPHNPSPASGARTGAEPTLDPRQQARSRKQPQAPALGPSTPPPPSHPDTQTRPQRLLGPARRSPRPLRLGGLTWPRSGSRLALLPLRLAPARPRGRCGGMGPAGGSSALPCHGDTRGRGRGTSANSHAPPPVPMPRPMEAPPLEAPPLAAKLCPSRRSPALSQETTPLIEPLRLGPWKPRPPLCSRNALSQLRVIWGSQVSL